MSRVADGAVAVGNRQWIAAARTGSRALAKVCGEGTRDDGSGDSTGPLECDCKDVSTCDGGLLAAVAGRRLTGAIASPMLRAELMSARRFRFSQQPLLPPLLH